MKKKYRQPLDEVKEFSLPPEKEISSDLTMIMDRWRRNKICDQ